MTALLYVLVAVGSVSLATEAFLADRSDPPRQAFLALSLSIAVAYVSFALSLLPGLEGFRALYLLGGCAAAPASLWTIQNTFVQDEPWSTRSVRAVYLGTAAIAPPAALAHLLLYEGFPRLRWPGLIAGAFAVYGFGVALRWLWAAQEATHLRIDRNRMRYLFVVLATAAAFTALEGLARQLGPAIEHQQLSLSSRGVALQGPFPPFSTVFTGLGVYFLYHSVVMSRMLDLAELFSRITTILLSALALVLIDGLTFLWVDTFTVYPFHSAFQIFLASLVFLAGYDPLRKQMAWVANRIFDRRSAQLKSVIKQLHGRLPTIIDTETLVDEILGGLHRSGRVPICSVYLWDDRLDAFRCGASRGHGELPPLQMVADHPFTTRFSRGAPWYLRGGVRRRAQHDPEQAEVLALMDAMNADLTLPLTSGSTVLGWIHLRDEAWSDGYSAEEILLLEEVARAASVVLSNIRGFQAIEEQKRLAALGAMSAGLAHEIRNPLAGVKGAAQFLQAEQLDGEAQEMLQVVIDETDRLNMVVTQFLDYARPFELALATEDINQIVSHSVMVVRAGGVPDGVQIVEALDPTLPAIRVDRTRMSQVMINLLQNALQAMPDGGTLTVRTAPGRRRGGTRTLEISVSDTGQGIEPEVQEKLFVPFFTTKQAGTGLGLPICRRIVEAHEGDLEAHSPNNTGSTFVVRLRVDPIGGERAS